MNTKKGPESQGCTTRGRQFIVFGRALPSEKVPEPKVVAVRVFARNEAFARSAFWSLNRRDHKLKKSHGEVIKVQEVHEKTKNIAKNYGIFLKYRSHTGVHNLFKEFRDVSLRGAVDQMYNEVAGNYKCSAERVSIIKTTELAKEQLKIRNPRCLQWVDTENLAYPIWKRTARPTDKKYNKTFAYRRPAMIKSGTTVSK